MYELLKDKSAGLYQSIIEHNPDAIFVFSGNGRVKESNKIVEKLLGFSQKEIKGLHYKEFIIPDHIEKANRFFNQGLQGISSEGRVDALNKDGEILHFHMKNIPLVIHDEIIGIFCVAKDLTELMKTKTTLSEMTGRFKALFDSSADAIDLIDLYGQIIDVNPEFENLYGWKREEVIGKSLPIIPKHRKDEAKSIFQRAISGEKVTDLEISGVRKDGSPVLVSLTFSPIKDGKGNVVALSGIARDITEKKKLEALLKESEERYRKVVEYSPKGIMIHRKGTIHYANPSALKILKVPDLNNKSIFSYIHPEDLEKYKKRISETDIGKELPPAEVRMILHNGEVIFVELGGIWVEFDGIPEILLLFSDITERKRMEQELKESEERYRLLAENSLDLIQLVNCDGIVTYASPSHKEVLGFPPEEYIGKWVFHQPKAELDEKFSSLFLNMAHSHQSFTCEIVRRHKNGHDIWVELKGTPMFDKERDFKYMMLVGREITERKKLQIHLEYLSFHDPLTGIPNRRLFAERLEQALKVAKRHRRKMAVMYIDMDKFKQINDRFGHDIGDHLLKQFANRVKMNLRETDTLARQGGDEFTVLLSEIEDEQDALKVAKRILSSIQEPWNIDGQIFYTTSSIGLAFYPKDGITSQLLMKNADIALYEAKENGKNNIKISSI